MVKNEKKLGRYRIQKTTDPVKMFNFYTSTCFEGQDILDENGRTFIVSEAYKDYTMMDVMTTLPQICGRIRDSKYRTEINHYYATSKYKDVTQEEFEANLWKQVEDAEHDAEVLNNLTQGGKDLLKHYIHRYPYVDVIDGKIIVDRNLASIEIVNYGVINGQYQNQINMNAALQKAGFQVTNDSAPSCMDIELENPVSIPRTPFKKIFEEYAEIRSETGMYNLGIFRAQRIEIEKPLVKKAYEILGPECVRELKYHQGSIKREIIKREHETLLTKIFLLIDGQLEKQVAIPKTEVNKKLDAVYQELGIKKKAKTTALKDLYNYNDTTKRVNGKTIASVTILSAKIKVGK